MLLTFIQIYLCSISFSTGTRKILVSSKFSSLVFQRKELQKIMTEKKNKVHEKPEGF